MSQHPVDGAHQNKLLARLPQVVLEQVLSHSSKVRLEFQKTVYEFHGEIEYVYFPLRGVLSFITLMPDGHGIEVGTVGNEGMLGIPAFVEAGTSPNRVIVQGAGEALRLSARELLEQVRQHAELRKLLALYQSVFFTQISQSVACNGLHPIVKRCCRWMLMTHDRLDSAELPMTHEFLSMMLGVRRTGVTEVLQSLQESGFIKNGRGAITVVDRKGLEQASCECYQIVNDEFKRVLG